MAHGTVGSAAEAALGDHRWAMEWSGREVGLPRPLELRPEARGELGVSDIEEFMNLLVHFAKDPAAWRAFWDSPPRDDGSEPALATALKALFIDLAGRVNTHPIFLHAIFLGTARSWTMLGAAEARERLGALSKDAEEDWHTSTCLATDEPLPPLDDTDAADAAFVTLIVQVADADVTIVRALSHRAMPFFFAAVFLLMLPGTLARAMKVHMPAPDCLPDTAAELDSASRLFLQRVTTHVLVALRTFMAPSGDALPGGWTSWIRTARQFFGD